MTEIKSTPPVDPQGLDGTVGVHMGYMRRDIDEIKEILKDTNIKIENIGSSFVSHAEFAEHLKADADHETRIRTIEANSDDFAIIKDNIALLKRIVYGAIALILTAVLSAIIYLVIKN